MPSLPVMTKLRPSGRVTVTTRPFATERPSEYCTCSVEDEREVLTLAAGLFGLATGDTRAVTVGASGVTGGAGGGVRRALVIQ